MKSYCVQMMWVMGTLSLGCQACEEDDSYNYGEEDMFRNVQNLPQVSQFATRQDRGMITVTVEVLDRPTMLEEVPVEEWERNERVLTFEAMASATYESASGEREELFKDRVLTGSYKVSGHKVEDSYFEFISLYDEDISLSYDLVPGSVRNTLIEGQEFELLWFSFKDEFDLRTRW